jgi:transposase
VLLPVERKSGKRRRGRPPEDNRNIINGILWRLRTGAPWRDVPEKYGKWNSISGASGAGEGLDEMASNYEP